MNLRVGKLIGYMFVSSPVAIVINRLPIFILAILSFLGQSVFAQPFSDYEKGLWSIQPVRRTIPDVPENRTWGRSTIDRFILQGLDNANLKPAPPANPRALVRRIFLDVTGLPPTSEQVEAFVSDPNPQAYDALVETLLDSRGYGERWAKHWLDLVRYAESDGYKQDGLRPNAWRYRDYVIDSLNADKPYDQFVKEQLAGDEVSPGDADALTATAFLRHWIYEYNQRDVKTQWDIILNDITDVTAETFLAMGYGCARCHDHKFDPILQKDYFRLRAYFAAILPQDAPHAENPEAIKKYTDQFAAWQEKTNAIRTEMLELADPFIKQSVQGSIGKFPRNIRPFLNKPADQRTPFENQIAYLAYRQVDATPESVMAGDKLKNQKKERWDALVAELKTFEDIKPKSLATVMAITDIGQQAPTTHIPDSGEQEDILPGIPTILDPKPADISVPESGQTTGRRTALASWITSPENPLTARVMVNRIWQHHFGHGLVSTPSDFGFLGEEPTHPELLDFLASELIANDWSLKHIHRLILQSSTYQQNSSHPEATSNLATDIENKLLWKYPARRLDAEQIRDSLLFVSGELDSTASGPSSDTISMRRSVYTKVIRNKPSPLLANFDSSDGILSSPERNATFTANQALMMLNSPWINKRYGAVNQRLMKMHPDNIEQRLSAAYEVILQRPPEISELKRAVEFVNQEAEIDRNYLLDDFNKILLNSNEFMFIY
ncbi:MAG: DUF1549 and DUF1553 domain-containing protein [Pirellulaceae bacterium]